MLLLGAAASLAGCSARRVYQLPANTTSSLPNAININTAPVAELEALPHVGRKTAEAIVRFRDENGPFRRSEYLLQIHGISEKRFLEMRHLIRTE